MPGTRNRGKNWTQEELSALLGIVEEVLPGNASGWAAVHAAYTNAAPPTFAPREAGCIRRKFSLLRRGGRAAGEALWGPEVARAKRVHRLIKERARGEAALRSSSAAAAYDDDDNDNEDEDDYRETRESVREVSVPPVPSAPSLHESNESPSTPLIARPSREVSARPGTDATPTLYTSARRAEVTPSRAVGASDAVGALSALAQLRSTIDRLVEQIESGGGGNSSSNVPSDFARLILEMEERAAAREMQYRRERDAEERRREEQRRQERLERHREQERREHAREERERKRDALLETLLGRLLARDEQAGV